MAQNGHSVSNNASSRFRRLGPMTLRGALGVLVAILVMGLIGWMYLSQASVMAETERHIAKLRQRKQDLQRQNDQLAYDIARLASVGRLERRARVLGYVPVSQARYLIVAGYPVQDKGLPDETAALAQSGPAERATPLAVAGWWKAIEDQFAGWIQTERP
jgi:type II secretory pathway component PulJ